MKWCKHSSLYIILYFSILLPSLFSALPHISLSSYTPPFLSLPPSFSRSLHLLSILPSLSLPFNISPFSPYPPYNLSHPLSFPSSTLPSLSLSPSLSLPFYNSSFSLSLPISSLLLSYVLTSSVSSPAGCSLMSAPPTVS